MRYIKLMIIALAVGFVAASCHNDEIRHPEVGDVKVSFAYLMDDNDDDTPRKDGDTLKMELATTTIINLEVVAETKSTKGAKVGIEFEDVKILDKDGNKVEVNEYNFVVTTDVLYLRGYEEEDGDVLPSKAFEIRLAQKKVGYSLVEFKAKLTGDNVGGKKLMVVSLK